VPPIKGIVVATSPDVMAEVISTAVVRRPDMILVEGRTVAVAEVRDVLRSIPPPQQCALIVVGCRDNTEELSVASEVDAADAELTQALAAADAQAEPLAAAVSQIWL
jgi:hypothetical protein